MKKQLAVLLSATMLTSLLAGCAVSTDTGSGSGSGSAAAATESTDAAAADTTAASGEAEEITWMFWDDLEATEDLISLGYKQTIDRFNKDYEGVYHVTPITTNLEEYYAKLNALVASGDTPDVFIVSPGPNLDVYVDPGVAAPLDDYLAQDGWKDSFSSDAVFAQQTYDGKMIVIPNGTLSNTSLTNLTKQEKRRLEFRIPVEYDVDLRLAKSVLEQVITKESMVLADEPKNIVLDAFEDSSMTILVHIWVKTEDYWPAKWKLMEGFKAALDEAGIVIPYNQLDIHMKES